MDIEGRYGKWEVRTSSGGYYVLIAIDDAVQTRLLLKFDAIAVASGGLWDDKTRRRLERIERETWHSRVSLKTNGPARDLMDPTELRRNVEYWERILNVVSA
jgi:hypothetical protein